MASPSFTNIRVYDKDGDKLKGYTGYDPASNIAVMAFRGSSNIQNWIADLDFFQTNYTDVAGCGPGACMVHEGFLGAWQEVRVNVTGDIAQILQQNPTALHPCDRAQPRGRHCCAGLSVELGSTYPRS